MVEPSTSVDFAARLAGLDEEPGAARGTCYSATDCEGEVLAGSVTRKRCKRIGGKSWKSGDTCVNHP